MTLNDITRELFQDGYMGQLEYGPVQLDPYREEMIDKAKEAILSDLLEIIGEDKKPFNTNFNRGIKPDIITKIENQLRQELREKVRKYCE